MKENRYELVWAKMPLSQEELDNIPDGHRIRPYLLVLEDNEYYYAFPTTSKVFTKKIRYVNDSMVIRTNRGKSLVMLGEIKRLPKENILSHLAYMDSSYNNEFYKKMKANIKYCDYPSEVVSLISDKNISYGRNDLIKINGEYYLIVALNDNLFSCLRVYGCEVSGTVLKKIDGLKYYVDISKIIYIDKNTLYEYISMIYGFSFLGDSFDLEEYFEVISSYDRVSSCFRKDDFEYLAKLPLGTIISYLDGDVFKRGVVLGSSDNSVILITGDDGTLYRDFVLEYVSKDIEFNFNIEGTLDDDRLSKLQESKLNKAYKLELK